MWRRLVYVKSDNKELFDPCNVLIKQVSTKRQDGFGFSLIKRIQSGPIETTDGYAETWMRSQQSCILSSQQLWLFWESSSNKEDIMPPHHFSQSFKSRCDCLQKSVHVMRPWIDRVYNRRLYIFQQNPILSHKTGTTQVWICSNLVLPDTWPPS